jgi:predicted nucleotidyltransferase
MTEHDKEFIIATIKKLFPKTKIYLYGSRARKDNSLESDIDIALDNTQKIDSHTLSIIKEEIEESTIPYTVDIVDLNAVSGDFKKEILKDGVLWQ